VAKYVANWDVESRELYELAIQMSEKGSKYLAASFKLEKSDDITKVTNINHHQEWTRILNDMYSLGWELDQWNVFNGVGNGVYHIAEAVFKKL